MGFEIKYKEQSQCDQDYKQSWQFIQPDILANRPIYIRVSDKIEYINLVYGQLGHQTIFQ